MRVKNYEYDSRTYTKGDGPTVTENSSDTGWSPTTERPSVSVMEFGYPMPSNPGDYSVKLETVDGRLTLSWLYRRYWAPEGASPVMMTYLVLAVLASEPPHRAAVRVTNLSTALGFDARPHIAALITAGLLTEKVSPGDTTVVNGIAFHAEDTETPNEWRSLERYEPRRFIVTHLPGDVLDGLYLDSGGWPGGKPGVARDAEDLDLDGSVFAASFEAALTAGSE